MTVDYEEIRRDVCQTIQEVGMAMTLRRVTGGEVDQTGVPSAEVHADYTVHGVRGNYHNREIDGTTIVAGDIRVILEAQAGVPEPQAKRDRLIIDGETWSIENCQIVAPGATTVLYKVQARE